VDAAPFEDASAKADPTGRSVNVAGNVACFRPLGVSVPETVEVDAGSASSLRIFWRADVLVRLCALGKGGRGRPPSN